MIFGCVGAAYTPKNHYLHTIARVCTSGLKRKKTRNFSYMFLTPCFKNMALQKIDRTFGNFHLD